MQSKYARLRHHKYFNAASTHVVFLICGVYAVGVVFVRDYMRVYVHLSGMLFGTWNLLVLLPHRQISILLGEIVPSNRAD